MTHARASLPTVLAMYGAISASRRAPTVYRTAPAPSGGTAASHPRCTMRATTGGVSAPCAAVSCSCVAAAAATQEQLTAAHGALTPPVVARMVHRGWLAAVPPEGAGAVRYTVGARLLAEMAPYIASTVGSDARACVICDHPVLLVCPGDSSCCVFSSFFLRLHCGWRWVETGNPVHQRQVQHAHPQGVR